MVEDAGRACGIVGFGTDPSVSDRAHPVARDDVGPALESWGRQPFRTDSDPASRLGAVIPGRFVQFAETSAGGCCAEHRGGGRTRAGPSSTRPREVMEACSSYIAERGSYG